MFSTTQKTLGSPHGKGPNTHHLRPSQPLVEGAAALRMPHKCTDAWVNRIKFPPLLVLHLNGDIITFDYHYDC